MSSSAKLSEAKSNGTLVNKETTSREKTKSELANSNPESL